MAHPQGGKRLLLLTHSTFYNHSSLEAIETVVPEWGKTAGFTVTSLEGYKQTKACTTQQPCDPSVVDLSMINAKYLSRFDAVMASTNGELPFSDEGRQALVDVVRNGKGWCSSTSRWSRSIRSSHGARCSGHTCRTARFSTGPTRRSAWR